LTTKIILEPFVKTSPSDTPAQRYQVWHGDSILIENTTNPEYEACRALLSKGITGRLETWRKDKPYPCMILDIEKAAGLTIQETDKHGPRLVSWRPYISSTVVKLQAFSQMPST
jgi:hypothetical protein